VGTRTSPPVEFKTGHDRPDDFTTQTGRHPLPGLPFIALFFM
jgi:hypothetical protein